MFHMFLLEKIFAGRAQGNQEAESREPRRRNRRIYERFNVDFKHLTMLSDQEILQVRDISAKGLSTSLSDRLREQMNIGDMYLAKMRYLGEIFDIKAKVSWKGDDTVGFEFVEPTPRTLQFMQRLLRPMEIAASLRQVDSAFMAEKHTAKQWFHGDEETDLYVWLDHAGKIASWQLITKTDLVEWTVASGVRTGTVAQQVGAVDIRSDEAQNSSAHDPTVDKRKAQFAYDVIMALPLPVKDQLIETIPG